MTTTPQYGQPFIGPKEGEVAGNWLGVPDILPYEDHMAAQRIPINRGIGISDAREAKLEPWERLGVDGAFYALEGASNTLEVAVIQVNPGKGSIPEKHLFEKVYYVVSGYGSTEVWQGDGEPVSRFEWREGSFFTIPRNRTHRLISASSSGARLIVAGNAARIINAFGDEDFIFDNDYRFTAGDAAEGKKFEPSLDFLTSPNHRAMWRTLFVPDVGKTPLAKDGQRAPGSHRVEFEFPGSRMFVFMNEYPTGRYSRAHYHPSGAVLLCVAGEGYTLNWPRELGKTPWLDGNGDQVQRLDYRPGGFVAAAPGGGDWFHQHFGIGKEPLRLLAVSSWAHEELVDGGRPDRENISLNRPITEGGHAIAYHEEDPFVRMTFERGLAKNGLESTMPRAAYDGPLDEEKRK